MAEPTTEPVTALQVVELAREVFPEHARISIGWEDKHNEFKNNEAIDPTRFELDCYIIVKSSAKKGVLFYCEDSTLQEIYAALMEVRSKKPLPNREAEP